VPKFFFIDKVKSHSNKRNTGNVLTANVLVSQCMKLALLITLADKGLVSSDIVYGLSFLVFFKNYFRKRRLSSSAIFYLHRWPPLGCGGFDLDAACRVTTSRDSHHNIAGVLHAIRDVCQHPNGKI